jgi:hypothetical protein
VASPPRQNGNILYLVASVGRRSPRPSRAMPIISLARGYEMQGRDEPEHPVLCPGERSSGSGVDGGAKAGEPVSV